MKMAVAAVAVYALAAWAMYLQKWMFVTVSHCHVLPQCLRSQGIFSYCCHWLFGYGTFPVQNSLKLQKPWPRPHSRFTMEKVCSLKVSSHPSKLMLKLNTQV